MDALEAGRMARKMLDEHGLTDWELVVERNYAVLGRTDLLTKRILISADYAGFQSDDEVRETILHEMAHVLDPRQANGPVPLRAGQQHDETFMQTLRGLGAENPISEYEGSTPWEDDPGIRFSAELKMITERLMGRIDESDFVLRLKSGEEA